MGAGYTPLSKARRGDLVAFLHSGGWVCGVVWNAPGGQVSAAHVWSRAGARILVPVVGSRWVASARVHRDLDMHGIAKLFGGRRFKTVDNAHKALVKHVRAVRALRPAA